MKNIFIAFIILLSFKLSAQEKSTQMVTKWAAKVDKKLPLNNYPRPGMIRKNWTNLNGQWDYAMLPMDKSMPENWTGKITVPFPVESYLSGVQKTVGKDSLLWYKRTFSANKIPKGNKVLLHFGAVDWKTTIYLNKKKIGEHTGGYTAFTIDITPYLTGGSEELVLSVWDPSDQGKQARGKQVNKPGGIYYTPVTGIWQTVWMEIVPETFVSAYRVQTDIDQSTVSINPEITDAKVGDELSVKIFKAGKQIISKNFKSGSNITLPIANAKLWSPTTPELYTFKLNVLRKNNTIDEIEGYFGMRKIKVAKDEKGADRLFLNNKAVFQFGPLDQGYWPDGIYTAPTEDALISDIKLMKEAGFNMVRKHVKVEPATWYYQCDKLGLIVWQDMPSGYAEIVPVKDHDHSIEADWMDKHYEDIKRDATTEKDFKDEWKAIISQLYNYPSICMWVPFNESWGQFKTNEILKWTKQLDPSRIVDGPSGWIDRGYGETRDYHLYGERLKKLPLEKNRALVIGEFGGLGYAVPGHVYSKDAWSYQGFKDGKALEAAYLQLAQKVKQLKNDGFSAAVYTQLTDVETEINGLVTYDREINKIPLLNLKKIHQMLLDK